MKKIILISILSLMVSHAQAEKNKTHHAHHQHSQLEISDVAKQPKVSLMAHPDVKSGWNLEIITENFEFAPAQVNQAHEQGKGHAHLYIDGKKIGRLYGHWRHITGLTPGKHSIKVTLNSNDHQDYTVKGEIVGAEMNIVEK